MISRTHEMFIAVIKSIQVTKSFLLMLRQIHFPKSLLTLHIVHKPKNAELIKGPAFLHPFLNLNAG
ncbi:hypothetical protein CWM47_16125 [Spirosoma pollinicola]|uniref:Uncharacterized protein n=1 Tax=Spirosoma pollinicola TaxID=2057025 RepID=A0A2K8Z049_9BACT|nr:hypothetical protein CWM47_16125 [Spirosoma pollinicola]